MALSRDGKKEIDAELEEQDAESVDNTSEEESSSSDDESSKGKPVKIKYLMLFPKFENEKEYEDFLKTEKDKKFIINGFTINHDEEKTSETPYKKYQKDYEHLERLFEKQKQVLERSFKKHGNKVEIELITMPKDEAELEELRKEIGKLESSDFIFLHAHGNSNCIGIADLAMNRFSIEKNLAHIKLPNPPPLLGVWCCNSGTKKNENTMSLIEKVAKQMNRKNESTISLAIIGPNGYLTTNPRSISVDQRKEKDKRIVQTAMKTNTLSVKTTPKTSKFLSNNNFNFDSQRDSIGSKLQRFSAVRQTCIATQLSELKTKPKEVEKVPEPRRVTRSSTRKAAEIIKQTETVPNTESMESKEKSQVIRPNSTLGKPISTEPKEESESRPSKPKKESKPSTQAETVPSKKDSEKNAPASVSSSNIFQKQNPQRQKPKIDKASEHKLGN